MKRQVFIFGYYGWKNVGDDAMLYGSLQQIGAVAPDVNFAVLSADSEIVIPAQLRERVKFIKPSPLPTLVEIAKSSVFAIGGGTHIFEYGKKVRALAILLRIFVLMLYSKLLRKRTYLLNIGVGPLSTAPAKLLSRIICQLADYISVRDKTSYTLVQALAPNCKVRLSFDSSVLLNALTETRAHQPVGSDRPILGISITPVYETYFGHKEKDSLAVNMVAAAVNDWLKRNPEGQVRLFTFKGSSKDDDVLITERLRRHLELPERVKVIDYNPDPGVVLAQMGQCSIFAGMRYHSCLFAYLNSLPLLVINYHPKCRALADEIGLPLTAVVSLEEILDGKFGAYLDKLQRQPQDFLGTLPVETARELAKRGLPQL